MKTFFFKRAYSLVTVFSMSFVIAGCATTTASLPPVEPAMHTIAEVDDGFVATANGRVNDPWEGFNRIMYKFNYNFDNYLFLPVVSGYEFIIPTFAQTGVSNFFNNIGEVSTFYNSLLQLKGSKALTTAGRLVTNTTIGILGLFDPATHFGMAQQNEDFGQTLGVWGVGTGPYVVVPVLGPNTVRSTGGFVFDAVATNAIVYENDGLSDGENNSLKVLGAIDTRHKQKFRYNESGYPFEYNMVRFLFRQQREFAVLK